MPRVAVQIGARLVVLLEQRMMAQHPFIRFKDFPVTYGKPSPSGSCSRPSPCSIGLARLPFSTVMVGEGRPSTSLLAQLSVFRAFAQRTPSSAVARLVVESSSGSCGSKLV